MKEMVIAIILVSIFVIVLFIFLILTTRRVNILIKRVYMNKLQDFDFLIEEKEGKLQQVQAMIHDAETELQALEEKKEEIDLIPKAEEKSLAVVMPKADFVDETFEEKYQQMKKVFSFDSEEKIKDFIKEKVDDKGVKYYETLKRVREMFDFDSIYKIGTYTPEDQKIIINDILEEEDRKRLKNLLGVKNFDINRFILKVDEQLTEFDPRIIICVNNSEEDYRYINSKIVMEVDKKIIEGFKIKYKGVIYDYSV